MTTTASIRIALVEDQPDVRQGLTELLDESEGLSCIGAYDSGESALEGVLADPPDLLILDLGLPGISGLEMLLRLKAVLPALPVLVFTVFDNDENVFEALKAGASGYLLKKETPARMLESIRELLDGGAPMSSEIARKVLASFREPPGERLREALSEKEIAILELLSRGYLYKEIAGKTGTSLGMIKQHLHKVYEKLHVQNRTEAVNKYLGR